MIRRRLLPEDIARTMLFLAADDSRMTTRQCIIVDAGLRDAARPLDSASILTD